MKPASLTTKCRPPASCVFLTRQVPTSPENILGLDFFHLVPEQLLFFGIEPLIDQAAAGVSTRRRHRAGSFVDKSASCECRMQGPFPSAAGRAAQGPARPREYLLDADPRFVGRRLVGHFEQIERLLSDCPCRILRLNATSQTSELRGAQLSVSFERVSSELACRSKSIHSPRAQGGLGQIHFHQQQRRLRGAVAGAMLFAGWRVDREKLCSKRSRTGADEFRYCEGRPTSRSVGRVRNPKPARRRPARAWRGVRGLKFQRHGRRLWLCRFAGKLLVGVVFVAPIGVSLDCCITTSSALLRITPRSPLRKLRERRQWLS